MLSPVSLVDAVNQEMHPVWLNKSYKCPLCLNKALLDVIVTVEQVPSQYPNDPNSFRIALLSCFGGLFVHSIVCCHTGKFAYIECLKCRRIATIYSHFPSPRLWHLSTSR